MYKCPVFLFHLSLELSDKAKQDLMAFEEQERQKRQNRYGGRGRGGGRGGRGRGGFPAFGMIDYRGGNRGRMNDQRIPLMGNMGMQVRQCTIVHLNSSSIWLHCLTQCRPTPLKQYLKGKLELHRIK